MHFLILAIAFYFVPAIVAAARHTHNTVAILLINIFFGWTLIGWVVALLMAICSAPSYYYDYRRG